MKYLTCFDGWFCMISKAVTMFENDERFKAVERARDWEDLYESYIVELERKVTVFTCIFISESCTLPDADIILKIYFLKKVSGNQIKKMENWHSRLCFVLHMSKIHKLASDRHRWLPAHLTYVFFSFQFHSINN